MGNISMGFDHGVPQIVCTGCGSCDSLMGRSLCSVTGRGCCHYFPEFTLAEIHRLVSMPDGDTALKMILSSPGTVINNYNIYAKGYFDKEGYDIYIQSGTLLETGDIRDHTIFFRACPFVKPFSGCTLPPRFRTTVCNFFVCGEIFGRSDLQAEFKPYLEERMRYSRWMYRESTVLQHILVESGKNLASDFDGALEVLRSIPLNLYDFPELEPVDY